MTGKSLLIGFGYINPRYYIEAENDIFVPNTKTKKFRHTLFVAAMVILTLLLVGCALTYTYDWLTAFFNRQINGPLSSEQSTYIKENGQVIKPVSAEPVLLQRGMLRIADQEQIAVF